MCKHAPVGSGRVVTAVTHLGNSYGNAPALPLRILGDFDHYGEVTLRHLRSQCNQRLGGRAGA
jgi:hypothetical protein